MERGGRGRHQREPVLHHHHHDAAPGREVREEESAGGSGVRECVEGREEGRVRGEGRQALRVWESDQGHGGAARHRGHPHRQVPPPASPSAAAQPDEGGGLQLGPAQEARAHR